MNRNDILYERDLLFSTNNEVEIGVVSVKLISSKQNSKIVTVVRPKSEHNMFDYAESILKSLDAEMFSRIKVNILKNVDVVFINEKDAKRIVFETENSLSPFEYKDLEESELALIK
jgi:hypothetical protein